MGAGQPQIYLHWSPTNRARQPAQKMQPFGTVFFASERLSIEPETHKIWWLLGDAFHVSIAAPPCWLLMFLGLLYFWSRGILARLRANWSQTLDISPHPTTCR